MRDELTDLYVEHRGAGHSLRMRRGEVIGELRMLGATEVHALKRFDPVTACHALYTLLPCPAVYPSTTDSEHTSTTGTMQTVGKDWDSSLCFALTGERASALTGERASALAGEKQCEDDIHMMCPGKCQAMLFRPTLVLM